MTYTKRGEPLTKECEICKVVFERPYKMTMFHWEKRRFCSQKCNAFWKKESGISSLAGKKAMAIRMKDPGFNSKISQQMRGKKYALGYKHTDKAKQSMSLKRKNELHPMWKEDNASYSAFHKWLVSNHGKANTCENPTCLKLPTHRYEYALLAGENHAHNREIYKMLCIPCHRSYDSRDNKLNVKL